MGYEHVWRGSWWHRVLPSLVVWLEWQGNGEMVSIYVGAAFVSTTRHSTVEGETLRVAEHSVCTRVWAEVLGQFRVCEVLYGTVSMVEMDMERQTWKTDWEGGERRGMSNIPMTAVGIPWENIGEHRDW
jgi:hypothetical protein